jgi:hypothetical protein
MMPKSSAMKRGFHALRVRGIHPDVAGMRIGMEEIVAEHLLVEHAHALRRQRLAVDAGGIQRGDVVGRDAAHALHRHRALGGVRPDHLRHVQVVRRVQPVAAQHAGIAAFALQVELGGESGFDFGHHLARANLVGARDECVRRSRRCDIEQGDVASICRFDTPGAAP